MLIWKEMSRWGDMKERREMVFVGIGGVEDGENGWIEGVWRKEGELYWLFEEVVELCLME